MKIKKPDYRWTVVALCFLMVMVSLGFASSTKSLFPDEIAKDLGTERSLVAIGESCRYIATSVVNIFFGFLIAKFGPKKLIIAGFCSLSAGAFIYSAATNLWLIYLAGSLLGIGFSWTTTTMVGYIIGTWNFKNKGTIMGAILASNGIGGFFAIQLVGNIIDPEVVGSYRGGYRLICAVLAVTAVIILIFLKEKPRQSGENVQVKKKQRGSDWVGIEFSSAVKKAYFWGILVCIFFSGMILQGTHGIVAMHMKDVGIDYGIVKTLLSVGSVVIVTAKFLTGFLYDRIGLRKTASAIILIAAITPLLLCLVDSSKTGLLIAAIYVVVSQYGMPLETIMLPIYANDIFGRESYAKILGIFVSVNTAGYAFGSPVMNLCFDVFGNYVPALIMGAAFMTLTLIILQFVLSAAEKERSRIISLAEASEQTPD